MVKMVSRNLLVRRWLCTLVTLLSLSMVLADPLDEKLFFENLDSEEGSRRVVQAGEGVALTCEAAGRPSPLVYWEYEGAKVGLNPVHYRLTHNLGTLSTVLPVE